MSPAIRLHGVVALLGRFPALAGVDLVVEPGEVVLIQGPNGAGKSTLLRLCAGLLSLAEGSATVLGIDLASNRRAVRPLIGLLGHKSALYEDLTVTENVRFWAEVCGAGTDQVDPALDRLGIARLADQTVNSLSAGQRRRTSLAATVVRRPKLWLLDEPHAGLDQAGRDLVDGLVNDAVSAGATVLVASHELERVRPIATRAVTVAGGTVYADVALAPPSAVEAADA